MSYRKTFLRTLGQKGTHPTAALLKQPSHKLEALSEGSDLDLIIDKSDLSAWKKFLEEAEGLEKLAFPKRGHVAHAALFFKDGGYLELDLIWAIARKQWEFLSAKALIAAAEPLQGKLLVAKDCWRYAYLLGFFALNNAAVPQKYLDEASALSSQTLQDIMDFLTKTYNLNTEEKSLEKVLEEAPRHAEAIKKGIDKKGGGFLKGTFRSIGAMWSQLTDPQPVITFSGVDGAGKTTIMTKVADLLQNKYRRQVIFLRHRPSVLPILSVWKYGKEKAHAIATETLPHTGQNKSSFSSVLRFGYYYLDYLLGQLWINFRYSRRGKIVLYDRYYFDFIIDSKRSNINMGASLPRSLYAGIKEPELNIFLYADTNVIRQRKQELDEQSITTMTAGYLRLFGELQKEQKPWQYSAIRNHELDETMEKIESHLQKVL